MKRVVWLMVLMAASHAHAQTACDKSWLQTQSRANPSANLNDYIGASAPKLFLSQYFMLPNDQDHDVKLKLSAGMHYTILLVVNGDALATGMEIRDRAGRQLQFEKVYRKPHNNILEMTYAADRSGTYTLTVRGVSPSGRSSCAAVLVRAWDDAEWKEHLLETSEVD